MADAYLAHPVLSLRLRECTELVIAARDKSAHQIFGSPDDIKFMSSMTLFDVVVGGGLFSRLLERFFDGERDKATLEILKQWEHDA